jgi:hypothetical protein
MFWERVNIAGGRSRFCIDLAGWRGTENKVTGCLEGVSSKGWIDPD